MTEVSGNITQKGVSGTISQKGVAGSISQKGVAGLITQSGVSGPEYCDEAMLIFNRLTGEQPSTALKELINTTIVGLKADGVFALGDCLYVRGVHTAEMACQNWIKNAHNTTLANSPTFTVKQGFTGATSKYINNNYNFKNDSVKYTVSNACVFFYNKAVGGGTKYVLGASQVTPVACREYIVEYLSPANSRFYINSNAYVGMPINVGDYIGMDRTKNLVYPFLNGLYGASQTKTADTQLADLNNLELCLNSAGIPSGYWINGIMSASFYGGYLGSTKMTALYNRIKYFSDNVGGTF